MDELAGKFTGCLINSVVATTPPWPQVLSRTAVPGVRAAALAAVADALRAYRGRLQAGQDGCERDVQQQRRQVGC